MCQKVYPDATCSQDTGLCDRPALTTTTAETTTTPEPSESLKKCEFYYALQRINAYRAAVANGVMPIPGGELPGCTTMFALDCDPSLELLAKFTVQDCQPKNLTLPGNPLNFFWISRLPKDQEEKDVIDMALATWMSQINVNGTKAREYKNMLYSKVTKGARAFKMCDETDPVRHAVACMFNAEAKKGEEIYDQADDGAEGCTGTNDCEELGATCGTEGLCYVSQVRFCIVYISRIVQNTTSAISYNSNHELSSHFQP
ncbi:hypothetical protein GCK32_015041 [Trichostrongylus colubriformis]|uniref:SCP domain-containing protein n=1 Tax=Trichostrongylus colubriformis TaxID=6319 RepID=A0AAN8G1B1_TRICO